MRCDRANFVLETPIAQAERGAVILAPALKDIPASLPLVMATLPILDWNARLWAGLSASWKPRQIPIFASLYLVDPFICWDDMADLLRKSGIQGVLNFPCASMTHSELPHPTTATPMASSEIERLEWFGHQGFRLIYTSMAQMERSDVLSRLAPWLDGWLQVTFGDLQRPISQALSLRTDHIEASEKPIFRFYP